MDAMNVGTRLIGDCLLPILDWRIEIVDW
jgi:hypothetical protein